MPSTSSARRTTTPAEIEKEANAARLKNVDIPDCDVAGETIDTGSEAKFAATSSARSGWWWESHCCEPGSTSSFSPPPGR